MRMRFLKTIGYLFIVISLFISCENSTTIEPTPEPVYYTVTFNSDGGSSVESQRIEKGKTVLKPTNPIKEGYTFSNWYNGNSAFDFSTPINSDITLKASWSKNSTEEGNSDNDESDEENNTESGEISENKKVYTIIFNINDGSDNPITKTQSIEEGKASSLTTTVSLAFTRAGYVFSEWNTAQNGSGTKYSDGAEITLNSNLTLFAQWTAGNGTRYTVKHYQQNITDDNYTLIENDTQILTGKTGSSTNANSKTYEGFTAQTFEQKNIAADGNTTIEIYYNRNIITLTFSANGGTWSDGTVGDKIFKDRYGASFSIELPTKIGYKASWNEQIQNKFTIDKTYSVEWTQLSINYTVEHYQENADDDNYTLYQTETLTGLYNSTTSAESKNYDGFTAKSFEQISIVDNTVVKIYYARKRFSLIFEKNDGSSDKVVVSAKQGAKVINYAPKFSRPYYKLDWNIATSKLVTQDETFIAQWTGQEVTLVFCANYEPCSYPYNYQIFRNGEAKTIQKDLFLRSGYTLRGWTTQKNSNVIAYENEATITYHINSEEPSTFYAVWQKNLTVEATKATSSITGISDAGLYLIKITGTITTAIKEEINAAIASSSATIELDLSECQIVDWQFGEPIDAEYAAGVIRTITETGTYTLKIIGILSSSAMSEIADVIKTREGTIELDISETTALQALPKNCFKDCKNIKTIVLPNGITTVGASCFENCNSLSSVNLPVSVTKIEEHAFDKCFSITDIEIPQNVTYIGYCAFAETGISKIVIPNGVSLLPAGVFNNCKNLASITLPETLTQIAGGNLTYANYTSYCNGAFANCTSLTQIELPSSLKTLGAYTFYGCDSLTSINLDKITSFGANALCGTKISSITLSSEITIISDEAFSYLTALTSINVPDGVTRIGKRVNCNCKCNT